LLVHTALPFQINYLYQWLCNCC